MDQGCQHQGKGFDVIPRESMSERTQIHTHDNLSSDPDDNALTYLYTPQSNLIL